MSRIAQKFRARTVKANAREECLANLRAAIALILEHRREESLRALPPDARHELLVIG